MKEISNAQGSILNTQNLIQAIGHWTLGACSRSFGVERWAFSLS